MRTLVLGEYPNPAGLVFGGQALTLTATRAAAAWLRGTLGNKMVDNAYKTIAAAGHVYVEPIVDARYRATTLAWSGSPHSRPASI